MLRNLLPVCLALMACDADQADIDTGDPDDLPDITGTYTADALLEPSGCEAEPTVDPAWIPGALQILGAPEDLTFAFEDGAELAGSIDAAFTFTATGTVVDEPWTWDVVVDGLAFLGDSGWNLDGDLVADVVDSTSGTAACTLSGRLEAVQDPP